MFADVLRSEYNRFANEVERGNGQGYANTYLSSQAVFNALQTIYRTVGPMYARRAFNSRERQKSISIGSFDFWVDAILQYLGDNFYNRGLLRITETTRKHFLDILNQGFREGWSPLRTAEYIREDPAIDSVIRFRAEMISRTETGRAIHSGTFVGADKSPFVKVKEWISAKDSRTRRNPENKPQGADHWRLDGQVVEFSEQFTDPSTGTKLEHPHDPKARAIEVVNCRCTYAVLNKVDKNGNLIRKPNNSTTIFPVS